MSEIRANQIQNPAQDGGPVMVGLTTVQGTLDVTGLTTTQNLFVVGVTTFNSDVTIGGTLTYEDVTRVDSLGLSTFRAGLIANSVSGVSTFQRGVHLATTTGDVGIGTISPNAKLQVAGDQPETWCHDYTVAGSGSNSGAAFIISRDNAEALQTDDRIGRVRWRGQATDAPFIGAEITGQVTNGNTNRSNTECELQFGTMDSGDTGALTKMTLTSSGRLGIGTDAPFRQLEVFNTGHATAAIKGDTQTSLFFVDTADSNIGQISYVHADNDMYFRVNDAERLRINSSGQVGIASDNPRKTMDVSGTACMNVNDLGNVNGNVTLNFNTNNNYVMTLTGTTQFLAPTGIATGQSGVIVLKQDGTGSRTATWDSSFKFKGGTAPTLSTGAGKSDAVAYFCHEPPYIIAGTFIGIGSA